MHLQNAVALVTGANRGLGLAFAKGLLERGVSKVYAAAREPVPSTVPGIVPVRLDVTRPEQLEALVREAGDVTLLINNAGISQPASLTSEDVLTHARNEMETNYLGPLATSRAFAPILARNGGGGIINVLSVLSWHSFPGNSTYSASKAAAWAMTNGLRHELRGQKTQVVALHVGFMDTDMAQKVTAPKANPTDVVSLTLAALEAGEEEVLADDVSRMVKQGLSSGGYLGALSA